MPFLYVKEPDGDTLTADAMLKSDDTTKHNRSNLDVGCHHPARASQCRYYYPKDPTEDFKTLRLKAQL